MYIFNLLTHWLTAVLSRKTDFSKERDKAGRQRRPRVCRFRFHPVDHL